MKDQDNCSALFSFALKPYIGCDLCNLQDGVEYFTLNLQMIEMLHLRKRKERNPLLPPSQNHWSLVHNYNYLV